MKNRVVVTGVGPVTPIGSGRENFWNAALAGTDGSGEVQKFDTSIYRFHRACVFAALHRFREAEARHENLEAGHGVCLERQVSS